MRSIWREPIVFWAILGTLLLVCIAATPATCNYMSGQGDAPEEASKWMSRNYPGVQHNLDCQGRDSDDDGYISCTVVFVEEARRPIGLECASGAWWNSGCGNSGCRLAIAR